MNKFNKKLTLSLPEDPLYSNQNYESPSHQESFHHDRDNLLQYKQYRDGDSQFGDTKNQINNTSKAKFVQFEQFNLHSYQTKGKYQQQNLNKTMAPKRNFMIEVPDRDDERFEDKKLKNNKTTEMICFEEEQFKQPPAPSKGSKFGKVFVFPSTPHKQSKEKTKEKMSPENEKEKQQLKSMFQLERQEFYKQKFRLQKQLLIKNGQIQMLHKLLTENLSSPHMRSKQSQNYQNSSYEFHEMESILLQKDLQINELLQKISELNNFITKKNQEIGKKVQEISSAHSIIESLRNQLYVYEKKDESEKLTKKFYHFQNDRPVDFEENIEISKKDFGSKGLENLYKRIEMVRLNRMQFDTRNKIKSDASFSQTTKNRSKGAFDFKGKTFEASTNLNKSKYY